MYSAVKACVHYAVKGRMEEQFFAPKPTDELITLSCGSVFVYGFPKNAKANLNAVELDAYQKLAQSYLSFSDEAMAKALDAGELEEVSYNGDEVSD